MPARSMPRIVRASFRAESPFMNHSPNCPSCRQPMDVHEFERHDFGKVELDVCYACQGIWFDQHENQQLTPGSVTELFRLLHEHRDTLRHPVAQVLACPRCGGRLEHGYDVVRSGRYVTHRCAQRHGRFSSFSSFMIEKGFVRQLSKPEIADLSERVGAIYCTGCGAPVDIRKDHACPHCRSAFSLIDPEAVQQALKGYHLAEDRRTTRDPRAVADALIENERGRHRVERQAATRSGTDLGSMDVGDLVMAGVEMVWKLLR
jgi:Zn-finger nucleic acid-binding protein